MMEKPFCTDFCTDLFIHSPFWSARLESLSHAVAIRMVGDLDNLSPLGIGDAAKPFWKGFKHDHGKSDSNIDFLFRIKKTHPQKIVLIQIGEFYETWGIDSIFLVEHCGINRMGRKGPRAGMPLANIQSVLNDLTEAGFSVVVCEQADDIHKKNRKIRFISEILTPSSPTYTYGMAMSHRANICFPEAPPEFGITANSKGIKMVEINPDLRTLLVLEGLTQEAAIIRLNKYSGRLNRIFLHEKTSKSLIDAANLKFHNLVKISGYTSRAFPSRVEELIKIDLGLDANIPFIKTESLGDKNSPYPLYQHTAEQIGILPKRGIPDLISLMLPAGSPATCKYIVRNLLLNPPPKKYSKSLREAVSELQSGSARLPILIVSNPVRYIKTLNKNEAHPEILKDLFCLAEIFLNCEKNSSKNFIKNILEIVSYISGVKAQENILKNTSKKIIEILCDILPKEEDLPYVPKNELIPTTLFERTEEEFRGRISRNSNEEIFDLYKKADESAKKYEEILEKNITSIIKFSENEKGTKARKTALSYDMHNNVIWIIGSVNSKIMDECNLIRPLDRYGKEVKDRWTTKDAEDALQEYKEIAKKTFEAIRQVLKKASKDLSPYCLPIIHLATFSNLVKTIYLHIKECQPKNWTINFDSEKCVNEKSESNEIALTNFFPYWMKPSQAVTNSFTFDGTCLLTGHNMAGKSTLIRSLAATTLLGSCGFMFPAKCLSIEEEIDGWYIRTGASDDPEAGLSAFAVEMTDIKVALRDASQKSFLLIDELGKGTESKAGHAIAASVLEYLAKKNIRSIFATHWHEIFVNPSIKLDGVRLIKMHCDGDDPSYKVEEGVDLNSSAFYTAAKIGVDQEIISRAEEIARSYDGVGSSSHKDFLKNNFEKNDFNKKEKNISEKKTFEKNNFINSSKNNFENLLEKRFEDFSENNFDAENFSENNILFFAEKDSENDYANFPTNNFSENNVPENSKSNETIKKILASISKTKFSQIEHLKENETPSLNKLGHSVIYIFRTKNNFFYIGETDNLPARINTHRNNLSTTCEFFYTIIKSGKSTARKIEQQLITKLKDEGFPMLSIADGGNLNFGVVNEDVEEGL